MRSRSVWAWLIVLTIMAGFGWTLRFLYAKSQDKPVVFATRTPHIADVVLRTVASGAIVPRREVIIKPRVSGVLDEVLVEPGQKVAEGDLIASIKIIPNVVSLNAAEARLAAARISRESAQRELARLSLLRDNQLISQGEFNQFELTHQLARQEVAAAEANLQLVREGAIRGSGKVSNQVRSTVDGTVIEVPVKQGASVIEANPFSEGTTIASVADMSDMVFEGHVDESEVGKLKLQMPARISIGALEGIQFDGVLEYISPKGVDKEGTIEFEIRVALTLKPDAFVRANYSANAEVILDRREQVLVVPEALVQFDAEKRPFVEVMTQPQVFERRAIELGLSDGLAVELKGGVDAQTPIKVPVVGGQP